MPPCTQRGEQISEIKMEQALLALEVKSLKESNATEHQAILDAVQEMRADMKGLRRILIGEQGDNGIASRVRRVEEAQVRHEDIEARLQTRDVESAKSNKLLAGAVIGSGVAFLTGVGAIIADIVGLLSGGGGTQ